MKFEGEIGGWKTQLIRSAAVAAILGTEDNGHTNIINALAAAEERGVVVRETAGQSQRAGQPDPTQSHRSYRLGGLQRHARCMGHRRG